MPNTNKPTATDYLTGRAYDPTGIIASPIADQRDFGDEHTVKRPPTPTETARYAMRELAFVAENIASNARRLARCVEELDPTREPAEDLEHLSVIVNQTIARVCESWPIESRSGFQATGLLHIIVPDAVFDNLRIDTAVWEYMHYPNMQQKKDWLFLRADDSTPQDFRISLFREHNRTQAEVDADNTPDDDSE